MGLLRQLIGSGDFMPHGYCCLWNYGLVWLHVISDSLIAGAYFTIPVTLLWFVRKRRNLPFSRIFVLFGIFIIACGATHLMEIWNLWHANYWLAGAAKAVTAAASVGTAILLDPNGAEGPGASQPRSMDSFQCGAAERNPRAQRTGTEPAHKGIQLS